MNDRLLNNPIPPREINPAISPELQEIIYRALERDPKNRYATAHEFALDLQHPEKVGVAERPELRDWKKRRTPWVRKVLFYVMLALIPVVIFGADASISRGAKPPNRSAERRFPSRAAAACVHRSAYPDWRPTYFHARLMNRLYAPYTSFTCRGLECARDAFSITKMAPS